MVFLLPFKGIGEAKTRWSQLGSRRHELVLKLLQQNLQTVSAVAGREKVFLVTPDQSSLDHFHTYRGVLTNGVGLNRDLNEAVSLLKVREKPEPVCVLLPDLPGLSNDDVNQLICSLGVADIAICPDTEDFGTNALVLRKENTIPFSFEGASFDRHIKACQERDIDYKVLRSKGLAQDCDSLDDLERFCLI